MPMESNWNSLTLNVRHVYKQRKLRIDVHIAATEATERTHGF